MFWSLATFGLANDDDMRTFPLRSLLTRGQDDSSSMHGENELSRHSTHYYDAKSSVNDFVELERWESMNGIHDLFENHDEVRKVFKESVGEKCMHFCCLQAQC